jgi:ABC-type multidrug transport system fused ATPase/permease subunit
MFALISYLMFFPISLTQFGTAVANLRAAASEYEVLNEFLDRPSNTVDLPGATDLQIQPNAEAPKIEFRNVSFAYPSAATSGLAEDSNCDNLILDDVSFTILPGQTAGFVGASGCGKSTLFKLMMRFYAPQKGTILVNDQDIRSVSGESLRRAFSVVTQNPKVFNGTLRENVDYGKMGSTDEDLIWACKKAELNLSQLVEDGDEDEFSKREVVLTIDKQDNASISTADSARQTPLDKVECTHVATCASVEACALDRKCGETGGKLSGGQQQRVALARALLKNGSVFLLDEPTAALDNKVSRELMKTMVEIQQPTANPSAKKTLLHITHRLEELKQAEQIFYFNKGRIMEQGTFSELVEQKGEFAEQVKAKDHA